MKEKLNGLNIQFWSIVFPRGRQDAQAVSQELVRLQKNTIKIFCETVNAQAEANMLKTSRLEGSHHAAMKQVCADLGIAVDLPLKQLATPEPEKKVEAPSVFGELPQDTATEAPLTIPGGYEGAVVPPIFVEPKVLPRRGRPPKSSTTTEQPLT